MSSHELCISFHVANRCKPICKNLLTSFESVILYQSWGERCASPDFKENEMDAKTQAQLTEHSRRVVAAQLAQEMIRRAERDAAHAAVIKYRTIATSQK